MMTTKTSQKKANITDVAKEAGVCIATVSRVLNKKDDVGAEYVRKVRRAVQKLNYHADAVAASMARKSLYQSEEGACRNAIAIVTDQSDCAAFLSNPHAHEYFSGMEQRARELDLKFSFESAIGCDKLPLAVSRKSVDGVIIKADSDNGQRIARTIARVIPVVLITHCPGEYDVPTVGFNENDGDLRVMKYLHGIGHRRIGFLMVRDQYANCSEPVYHPIYEPRLIRYRQLVRELHCEERPDYIESPVRDWATQSLDEVVEGALDRWIAMGAERPTAIYAAHDCYALPLITCARKKGLRIPEDLSVIGYLNTPDAERSVPSLTSIRVPAFDLGMAAVNLLCERIRQPKAPIPHLQMNAQLMVRESCAALPQA